MPPAPSRFSLHRSLFPSSQRATRHHTLSSDLFPQQDPRPCPPPRPTKKHRIPFYRRKIKSPPSHSMSFSLHISSIVSDFNLDSSSKPSFFSRVVNKVVPCVTDSPLPNQPKHICYPESHVSEIKLAVLQSPSTIDPPLVPLPLVVPIFPPSGFDDATPNAFQSQDTESSIPTATIPDKQVAMLDDLELMRNGGNGIPMGPDGLPKPLLPPVAPEHVGRKCLILDLDETLVHSSFKPVPQADFIVPVELEYNWHHFHVLKRPGVDEFLRKMGELYEVVIFTASLSKYADPVLDKLDTHQVVAHRLFRESCFSHKGNYVKDLSQLGRPISDTIILDNSPASYIFHPRNAVPVSSWFNDPHDVELTDLIPFLVDLINVPDVRGILDGAQ